MLKEVYLKLSAQMSWQRITLNRGIFPTAGSSTVMSLSSTIPGGEIFIDLILDKIL